MSFGVLGAKNFYVVSEQTAFTALDTQDTEPVCWAQESVRTSPRDRFRRDKSLFAESIDKS